MLLSSPQFETFLARLYTDPGFLDLFLNEPSRAFQRVPLSSVEMAALLNIDNVGLKMAAVSFTKKRAKKRLGGVAILGSNDLKAAGMIFG
jgi:hypothetical protein